MTSQTSVSVALRRLSEIQEELLAIQGVTGVGIGGTEEDAELHVYSDLALEMSSIEQVDRLTVELKWRPVSMSIPDAGSSPGVACSEGTHS